jgi:hypothetical protein
MKKLFMLVLIAAVVGMGLGVLNAQAGEHPSSEHPTSAEAVSDHPVQADAVSDHPSTGKAAKAVSDHPSAGKAASDSSSSGKSTCGASCN